MAEVLSRISFYSEDFLKDISTILSSQKKSFNPAANLIRFDTSEYTPNDTEMYSSLINVSSIGDYFVVTKVIGLESGEILEPFTIESKYLKQILSICKMSDILSFEFFRDSNNIRVLSGKAEITVPLYSDPVMEELFVFEKPKGIKFELYEDQILKLFKSTEFAISNETLFPQFTSLNLRKHLDSNTIEALTSNRYIFVRAGVDMVSNAIVDEAFSVLIPEELLQLVTGFIGTFEVYIDNRKIYFIRRQDVIIEGRLVEATPPPYDKILGNKYNHSIIVPKSELKVACDVNTLKEKHAIGLMEYIPEQYKLQLSTNVNGEETKYVIYIDELSEVVSDEKLSVHLNFNFLKMVVNNIEDEYIVISFNKEGEGVSHILRVTSGNDLLGEELVCFVGAAKV